MSRKQIIMVHLLIQTLLSLKLHVRIPLRRSQSKIFKFRKESFRSKLLVFSSRCSEWSPERPKSSYCVPSWFSNLCMLITDLIRSSKVSIKIILFFSKYSIANLWFCSSQWTRKPKSAYSPEVTGRENELFLNSSCFHFPWSRWT